jgi:hypothetical protein
MPSTAPARPSYLTITEIVFNYALYSWLSYLVAGWPGIWSGAGLFTTVLVLAIIVASQRTTQGQDPIQRTAAEPYAATDRRS